MKLLLVGLWITLVALGSTLGAATFLSRKQSAASAEPATGPLESDKTRVLNVPMIADGTVNGFVSVQLAYTIEASAAKSATVSPSLYLSDEAFRTLYSDPSFDFRHLERYDLAKFTKHLVDSTNARLGGPLIRDVLIADMSYSPKDADAKAAPN